jgi:hypothetical protein
MWSFCHNLHPSHSHNHWPQNNLVLLMVEIVFKHLGLTSNCIPNFQGWMKLEFPILSFAPHIPSMSISHTTIWFDWKVKLLLNVKSIKFHTQFPCMDEIGISFGSCSKHGKSIHISKLKTICIIMIKNNKQQPMLFTTHLFDEGNAFIIIFSNK